jgi:iron complex transport system substrate-binding protein
MRIASLQPSVTLTLHALGRIDMLCACTRYCVEALPELASVDIAIVQDSWTVDTEQIAATKPSLVIASVPYRMESLAALLKAGVPVLAFAPQDLAGIYDDIRVMGSLTDARQQAEALVATMQAALQEARSKSATAKRPLVYCEEWGKPLIHSQRWVAELVEAAGGEFLGTPGSHTTAEEIAAADPDVLVFAWCGAGDRVPLARVIEQRGWQNLRAVKAKQVYCIPDEFLNTPAHTLLEGLACLGAAIRPQVFPAHPRLISLAGK